MSQFARKIKFRRQLTRRSTISDSLTSLFLPWDQHHRTLNLANFQTGRTVTAGEFYLFSVALILLILGCGQIILSVWSLASKRDINLLVDNCGELAHVILPSAVLLLPSFWVTASIHNDRKSQKYLALVLILLIFSISLTTSGTYLGFTHHLRKSTEKDTQTVKRFTESMREAQKYFQANRKYKKSWNNVHSRFHCCGIQGSEEWTKLLEHIPESCSGYENEGCLKPVIKFLSRQINLFSGLNAVTLIILCLAFISVAAIYISNKRDNKN